MRDVLSPLFPLLSDGAKPCVIAVCMTAVLLFSANHVDAQVTTATLVGLVRDNSAS